LKEIGIQINTFQFNSTVWIWIERCGTHDCVFPCSREKIRNKKLYIM